MKIDLDHIHFWMCAIRESKDPMRTLDAFWRGQLRSKEWLINVLFANISVDNNPYSIDICGGWVGTLASMLFQSSIPIKHIRSIDIDPSCEPVAKMMNKQEEIDNKFCAVTADMCNIKLTANIIINTSFEHMTQFDYDCWLNNLPEESLVVLQTNNYDIPEHIRIAKNLENFKQQARLKTVLYAGELELPLYKRFMIIGRR